MNHYYDAGETQSAVVNGDAVAIVGEYGACFIVVESHNLHEWKRLATSQDEGERVRATMLEYLICKRKHANIV